MKQLSVRVAHTIRGVGEGREYWAPRGSPGKGEAPTPRGQSPEELDFVLSLLPANRESGNINTYKIKSKTNPRETTKRALI